MADVTIWWVRSDLRLADNAALSAALSNGGAVIPVFVVPDGLGTWAPGEATTSWLEASLLALEKDLEAAGSRLVICKGNPAAQLLEIARECSAKAVVWNRRYEPNLVEQDTQVKSELKAAGLAVTSFVGTVLLEPFTVTNKAGLPFRVFTPYWRHCQTLYQPRATLPRPDRIANPPKWPSSITVSELGLASRLPWSPAMLSHWQPGETGAQAALQEFAKAAVSEYAEGRDRPDKALVSRLSPALAFGELHPEQIIQALNPIDNDGKAAFVRQLYWRDFARHLLYHFPHTTDEPMNPRFATFPWDWEGETLTAWQQGKTGYPLIDAGMRELWATGWMHNRVRMNVASFLVKHLLLHWQCGARWFWDTLVDADLANNTMGWQWVAGCGADAAPYFRIFNPVTQGERFDPRGDYVRRWVPELRGLGNKFIHQPWAASAMELAEAGIKLGTDYPHPIVDHREARERALTALKSLPK